LLEEERKGVVKGARDRKERGAGNFQGKMGEEGVAEPAARAGPYADVC
jgi:hypothetical protein